jgi:Ser/Thr protein kinase RdoA (MazF antagonist)
MTTVSEPPDFADPEAAPGPLLASGRWSDIFILDDARLMRRNRYRDVGLAEVELLRHVASHGFPAPTAYSVHGRDLILERLHGPTLLQAMAAEETPLDEGARILADLHQKLHSVPPPAGAKPGQVVIHLDLHPANIILTERRGPVLIDWTTATLGSACVDVAVTAVVIAEVAVDTCGEYSRAAKALLAAFLRRIDGDPLRGLEAAIGRRLADPGLESGERVLLPQAAALVRRLCSVQ